MKSMLLFAAAALIAGASLATATGTETREGYVMPTACQSREAEGGPEAHTTKCALELQCVVTGYGLLIDGKFFELDDEGDQLALKYFQETKKEDHHLVKVVGDFSGEEVHVESLEPVSP